jgi:hypothetical protein
MDSDSRRIVILVVVAVVCVACLCICCVSLGVGSELYARHLLAMTPTVPAPTIGAPGPRLPGTPLAPGGTQPHQVPSVAPADPVGALSNTWSPEEQAYVAEFRDQSQRWSDSRQTFDTLMAVPNPADAGWKSDVLAQFSAWQGLSSQAHGLSVPSSLLVVQRKYLEAAQHFDSASRLGVEGIEKSDPAAFDRAKREIASADAALDETRAQLAALEK